MSRTKSSIAGFLDRLEEQGIELWVESGQLRFRAPKRALGSGSLDELRLRKPEVLAALREPQLSHRQRALWFIQRSAPQSCAYNLIFAARLRPELKVEAVEKALRNLVRRHEVLRWRFPALKGLPRVEAAPGDALDCVRVDSSQWNDEETLDWLREQADRPFDLASDLPMRVRLLTGRGSRSERGGGVVLALTVHHIVADFRAIEIMLEEIERDCRPSTDGEARNSPAPSAQYADFVRWEERSLRSSRGQRLWDYWLKRLEDHPPRLELPSDFPRPPMGTHRGARIASLLAGDVPMRLGRRAVELKATRFAVVLAAFQALLHRYSGQSDFLTASPMSGRGRREFERLVGYCANPTVLRANLEGDPAFAQLVEQARTRLLEALDHQDLPYPLLVERLQPQREGLRPPLCQVAIVWAQSSGGRLEQNPSGLISQNLIFDQRGADFDLALTLREGNEGIRAIWRYNRELFLEGMIQRLSTHFGNLLEDALKRPQAPLSGLNLMDQEERRQILADWSQPAAFRSRSANIAEAFEAVAAAYPEYQAIGETRSHGEVDYWSYRRLNERANRLAHRLGKMGIGRESVVAVRMRRTVEMAAAWLGVLKAGGAYLPLEASDPPHRVAWMLADSGAALLLTDRDFEGGEALGAGILKLDPHWSAAALEPVCNPPNRSLPDNSAYVIYTSGSTGKPKGIPISHRGLCGLATASDLITLQPGDSVGQTSKASFDAAGFEIWSALLTGSRLTILDRETTLSPARLSQRLRQEGIRTLFLNTALFHAVADRAGEVLGGVEQLVFGGERADPKQVESALASKERGTLINAYGPTENSVISTCWKLDFGSRRAKRVTIGRPVAATRAVVLDPHLRLAPLCVPGELCLAGDGLTRGYWGLPGLTAERFVPDPFCALPGARMYRSGDRVRRLADGQIDFLGRLDDQLKIRGFRIEPGEIESVLRSHPALKDAAVAAYAPAEGEVGLAAYLLAETDQSLQADPSGLEQVKEFASLRLPQHMVPGSISWLQAFPRTSSGKLDRRALPKPPSTARVPGEIAPPESKTEVALARIWRELLGIERLGALDRFFDRGGHSLLAVRLVSSISQEFGVELPIGRVFDHPSLRALSQCIEQEQRMKQGSSTPFLRSELEVGDALPLSLAQQRLWFLEQLDGSGAAYNLPLGVRLLGSLDVAALRAAINEVIRRHHVLRFGFFEEAGRPWQRLLPAFEFKLRIVDLRALPSRSAKNALDRLAGSEAHRRFSLSSGAPLLRALLVQASAGRDRRDSVWGPVFDSSPDPRLEKEAGEFAEHRLLLTLHHIICDGWSLAQLLSEVSVLYQAGLGKRRSPLPSPPFQFGDFVNWQQRWLTEALVAKRVAHWKSRLAGAPELLEISDRHPRPPRRSLEAGVHCFSVGSVLQERIHALGRRCDSTLFMTLLGLFSLLLSRYSRSNDLVLGTPIAGRNRSETQSIVGFLANTLPLRLDLAGDPRLVDYLGRVRSVALEAYSHADLPFAALVEAVRPQRSLSYPPVVQVVFGLVEDPLQHLRLPGLQVSSAGSRSRLAKFDLMLTMQDNPAGLTGLFEFRRDLLGRNAIQRLSRHFVELLHRAVDQPESRLCEIDFLTEPERRRLLEWSSNRVDCPRLPIAQLFESRAKCGPACIAVVERGEADAGSAGRYRGEAGDSGALSQAFTALSYAELNEQANQIARALIARGVSRGACVGICAERSSRWIAGALAILKAGGAYLPLDPTYPTERLSSMCGQANVRWALSEPRHLSRLSDLPVLLIDLDDSGFAGQSGQDPPAASHPESLAYVVYTSGSTGKPKGIAIPQQGVVRLVVNSDYVRFRPDDRVLHASRTSFDAATFEIWGPLLNGAAVIIADGETASDPQRSAEFIREQGVTICFLTASLFSLVTECDPGAFAGVRYALAGGEAVSPESFRRVLLSGSPPRHLLNGYGPSENTTFSTAFRASAAQAAADQIPIGGPIANSRAFVLDSFLQLSPPGVEGELCLGGDGLAWGYLSDPRSTASSFVPDPFGGGCGERLFRSADRVRLNRKGQLEFRGRFDDQLKIRGFRVEPGEIEIALKRHPMVSDAAVLPGRTAAGLRLEAYCSLKGQYADQVSERTAKEDLKDFLKKTVPNYLVPSTIAVLERLPLTPHGKIDRAALRCARETSQPARQERSPRTPIEELIGGIWCDLLQVRSATVDDDFFQLGGHSLVAAQVIARLRSSLSVEVPLGTVFMHPRLGDLAGQVDQLMQDRPVSARPIRPRDSRQVPPLSLSQRRLWFLHRLGRAEGVYNMWSAFRMQGPLNIGALRGAFAAIVQRHESLRTSFPRDAQQPRQHILRSCSFSMPIVDLAGLPALRQVAEAHGLAKTCGKRVFDLSSPPLLRSLLIRLGETLSVGMGSENPVSQARSGEWVLTLAMHHIISDAWSIRVFLDELSQLYSAATQSRPNPLARLEVQFADYALWERRRLEESSLRQQADYWRNQLEGAPRLFELPSDYPRPQMIGYRGSAHPVRLGPGLSHSLRKLSQGSGATLHMTLLASLAVFLSRYSGSLDLVIGTPVSGRSRRETEPLIGFFVNMLPLRIRLEGTPTWKQLLKRVREVALQAYTNQELPFDKLVEDLNPHRSLSHAPIFQVVFDLQNQPPLRFELPQMRLNRVEFECESSLFDLTLAMIDSDDELSGVLEYSLDLFEPSSVARMSRCFTHLLRAIVEDPDRPVADLPLVGGSERRELIGQSLGDSVPIPNAALHELVSEQAKRHPQRPAAVGANAALNYAQLDRQAQALASHLQRVGVEAGDRIALLMDRTPAALVALLAALKAGGCCVPLDPAWPSRRLKALCQQVRVRLVLSQCSLQDLLPDLPLIRVDGDWPAIRRFPADSASRRVDAGASAYMIFTSGSTGEPKGVWVAHQSIVSHCMTTIGCYGLTSDDRVLQSASLSFDVSFEEIFPTLLSGGAVVFGELAKDLDFDAFGDLLTQSEVSVVNLPAAFWQAWSRHLSDSGRLPPTQIRLIVAGSDVVATKSLRDWQRREVRKVAWINAYGTTEAVIGSALYRAERPQIASLPPNVPIGRPKANAAIYLLSSGLEPAPPGAAGEIFLGGPELACGYWDRPSLTAERFLPDPFSRTPGQRIYRSGDRGRRLGSGDCEFMGRLDAQASLRGFRIEPGEIEAVLERHPAVAEAGVALVEKQLPTAHLVAFVVSRESPLPSGEGLHFFLSQRLPEWMIPAEFRFLEKIPRTASAKIDRRALAALEANPTQTGPMRAPRSSAELKLATLWREVLQVGEVDLDSSFFDAGGHSLLLIELQNRIAEAFEATLSIVDLFRHPTIRSQAAFLNAGQESRELLSSALRPRGRNRKAVAIIGMACRFPGADSPEEFWRNLCEGVESIRFFGREELLSEGVPEELLNRREYVPAAAVLEGIDRFDAEFFGFAPSEAALMDPQARLFLETAWLALEHAACDPSRFAGSIGVYAGSSLSSYLTRVVLPSRNWMERASVHQLTIGNDKDSIPSLTSYKLGLRGPSIAVQATCATSLVAVHEACRSLQSGDCDLALAGGVSVHVPHRRGYLHQQGMVYSPDGHCRPYDAQGQGTVLGNGAGVVVLKRLDHALEQGDRIHAVILGSAVNNDGADRAGFTAPGVEGQRQVIRRAHLDAEIEPDSLGYVEGHGTATELGDPIEVRALTDAFRAGSSGRGFCALGSVKSNLGHLDAAAGVAGLIKTALILEHGIVPPTLHFSRANPLTELESGPFFVNSTVRGWPKPNRPTEDVPGKPRRAGVSSFGIGGTNCHVVLEQPPSWEHRPCTRQWHLIPLSARTESALKRTSEQLREWILGKWKERSSDQPSAGSPIELPDVAYTLATGRRQFEHRQVLVCRDLREAGEALASRDPERLLSRRLPNGGASTTFLFPGQGTLYPGMGRQLYRSLPGFRRRIDRCNEILQPCWGQTLLEVLEIEGLAGHPALAHPALIAFEIALAGVLSDWGIRPQSMIGHSAGEYTAAHLAGVLALEDVLTLAWQRGRLFEETPEGAMLSVPLSAHEIERRLDKRPEPLGVSLAAINAPEECVVSGEAASIESLRRQLEAEGLECLEVEGNRAYHSYHLEPIIRRFREHVARVRLNPPQIPYTSCVSGDWMKDEDAVDPDYWIRHMRLTVQFSQAIEKPLKDSRAVFLELGPGRFLSALVRRHPAGGRDRPAIAVLPGRGTEISEERSLMTALGRAWLQGVEVDWAALFPQRRRKVALPGYPFERSRYWFDAPEGMRNAASGTPTPRVSAAQKARLRPEDWFSIPSWTRLARLPSSLESSEASPSGRMWLIFEDDCGLGAGLRSVLKKKGHRTISVLPGFAWCRLGPARFRIDPRRSEDYRRLLGTLGECPQRIVHFWCVTADNGPQRGRPWRSACIDKAFRSLVLLAQEIGRMGSSESVDVAVVSNDVHEVTGQEVIVPEKAVLLGPVRSISEEGLGVRCRNIDVAIPQSSREEVRLLRHLFEELSSPSTERVVAMRQGFRWVPGFQKVQLPAKSRSGTERGSAWLILGGLGGIGLTLAEHLARTRKAKLALTTRRSLPPRSDWDRYLKSSPIECPVARRLRRILEVEAAGGQVVVLRTEADCPRSVNAAVGATLQRYGSIDGVVHAAGVPGSGWIERRNEGDFVRALAVKTEGTRNLEQALRRAYPKLVVLCSSLASVLDLPGQCDYTASNAFLDAVAHSDAFGSRTKVVSLGWDMWSEVGFAADALASLEGAEKAEQARALQSALRPSEAGEAFERALASGFPHLLISPLGLDSRLRSRRRSNPGADGIQDRQACGGVDSAMRRPGLETKYEAPRDRVEERLVQVLGRHLGIEGIGVHDDFFELGGHSLMATQLVASLKEDLGASLTLQAFLSRPTVAGLAGHLKSLASEGTEVDDGDLEEGEI